MRRRSRHITAPEVTLTPLIDTVLTLLIIFMVTTPVIKNSLKLTLPEVKNSNEKVSVKQENLEIFVDKSGKIEVNSKLIKPEELAKHVKNYLQKSKDKIIIINGDKDGTYNSIMKVLDQVNSVEGEKYVALVAKKTVT